MHNICDTFIYICIYITDKQVIRNNLVYSQIVGRFCDESLIYKRTRLFPMAMKMYITDIIHIHSVRGTQNPLSKISRHSYTGRYRYIVVNFLTNPHIIHTIARQRGRVSSLSDLCSAVATAVLHVISWWRHSTVAAKVFRYKMLKMFVKLNGKNLICHLTF